MLRENGTLLALFDTFYQSLSNQSILFIH